MTIEEGIVQDLSIKSFFERYKQFIYFSICLAVGIGIWSVPPPEGVRAEAWHLLALFIATILGIILKPFPMGAMALFGIVSTVVTKTLTFEEAFSGFQNSAVWLIVIAFFIARGFISTGLGNRVAYFFMSFLGKNTLGLSYGMLATELILAPAIPSLTARTGGIIFPIIHSLAKAFGSDPNPQTSRKLGAFLIQVAFQGSAITSAMFLTSMAGNPLVAQLASDAGAPISWTSWMIAAIVPGLISLIVIPYFLYRIYPPEHKKTPDAYNYSKKKLQELGKMSFQEWIMLFTFFILITLWIAGSSIGLSTTVAALIGLSGLILSGVLKWKDIIEEKSAWDTFFWFAALVTMAGFLNKLGLTTWFSSFVVTHVEGYSWPMGFVILSILYYYSHYFFASNLAHIGAMYAPFVLVAIALGVPKELAALSFAFFSSLFGGLTHYGCGPAPIMFGSGYVSIGSWWKIGFMASVVNIFIWLVFGGLWWKVLGLW